ncbi:MAG: FtsX-like permease family protein, partial [Acidobacteriota bacterium]
VAGSPQVLETLGVQILSGRALTRADAAARPRPAVITASLARKLWEDKSPLGEILSTELRDGRFVVVGIASNFAYGSLGSPVTDVVVTAHSLSSPLVSVVVNAASPAITSSQVQRAIEAAMPDALWIRVSTGREIIAKDLGQQRLGAWFFSGFGLSALLLGIGGVFGLVAYLGESRYREFGVRLALGATPEGLMRLSLAVALRPVAFGVAIGCLVAALVSRVFSSLLTGLSAVDPVTYVLVAVAMVTSATAAALVAAWKLRKIAPTEALRLN